MASTVKVEIRWNNIPGFLQEFPRAVRLASREAAENIRMGAALRSRVRTGAMKNGWKVIEDAEGLIVTNPVPYTIFNEYGTVNMTSQPMLTPAVEDERRAFPERVAKAINTVADQESR